MNQTFPYWFAILFSGATLIFYLVSAIWSRSRIKIFVKSTAEEDFNLGLPDTGDKESLFATSLIAAGTSLSTVFVFFLTAAALFGWWLFLSPLMFLLGNIVMFAVYRRIKLNGYFSENPNDQIGAAGLVPFLATRLTGSRVIGYVVLILSLINLIAVLVLELVVTVDVITYLVNKATGTIVSDGVQFTMFAILMALLLGYVYVGGFRAVVASDVWQMKLMKLAVFLSAIALGWVIFTGPHTGMNSPNLNGPSWGILLMGFILNVVLANLFVPLSQEASWQRFRAFSSGNELDDKKALKKSLIGAGLLWLGLIATSFLLLFALTPDQASKLTSLSNVLEQLKGINDSVFPLFLFPLMVVAGLSAMYSTSDTCVSSILYLLEYPLAGQTTKGNRAHQQQPHLRRSYHVAMVILFFGSLGVYGFVRYWNNPTILQLVFSVFSNLVVIAPTVLTTVFVPPTTAKPNNFRKNCILVSLSLGFIFYWFASLAAMIRGQGYLWLSQLSILTGLVGATLPVLPVWFNRKKK